MWKTTIPLYYNILEIFFSYCSLNVNMMGKTQYKQLLIIKYHWNCTQRAKKVVIKSPGLVDFAIKLVNSVFNLPDGQVMFFKEFE